MYQIKEAIVVEGKYDKNTLSQVVKATIITTSGFGIFSKKEQLNLLRRLAAEKGLIVMTDSDGAGFVIRNYLKSSIPKEQLKHAYIPDIYGKEKRKEHGGKEGKIGVEGMEASILVDALKRAGATFLDQDSDSGYYPWTKSDLYDMGLLGKAESKMRRKKILSFLNLPEHLSTNAFLEILCLFYTPKSLQNLLSCVEK